MRPILQILCMLFAFSAFAGEDPGSIRGFAEEKQTGYRLRAAIVAVKMGKKEIVRMQVSEAGEFVLEGIEPGIYDIECSQEGYITQRIVGLEVKPDRVKLAYFYLSEGNTRKSGVEEIYTYAAVQARLAAKTNTASKDEESAANAPATVYIITQEDIFEQGYNSLSDVMETIPGIEINNRAAPEHYNVVSVRGLWGNNKVLILVNGVRFSPSSSDLLTISENFNVKTVNRIEVLLGPAAAVYGADAVSAVVNIITESGEKIKGGGFSGSYGMYHTTANSFIAGGGNQDISFVIDGSFYRTNGASLPKYYDKSFEWYNEHYATNGEVYASPFATVKDTVEVRPFALPQMAYSVSAQLKIKKWDLGTLHNSEQHSSSASVRPEYSLYWNDAFYGFNNTTIYLRNRFQSQNDKLQLESVVQWNSYSVSKTSNFVNTFSSYNRAYKFALSNGLRWEENLTWNISEQHQVLGGILLQSSFIIPKSSDFPHPFKSIGKTEEEQDLYYIGTDVEDGAGNSLKIFQNRFSFNRITVGAFAQYRFAWKEKLFLTLGVRYDQAFDLYNKDIKANFGINTNTYNNISPRFGLVYRPIKSLGIKLFAGRAFLAPSGQAKFEHYGSFFPVTDSLGNTSIQGGFWQLPNPSLKPERVNTFELGVDYSKGSFAVLANGFFNYALNLIKKDLVFDAPIDFMGVTVPVYSVSANESSLMSYGGSFQVIYRTALDKQERMFLQLRASYNYTDGKFMEFNDDEGAVVALRLPFSARHTGKLGLMFRYKDLVFSADGLFRNPSVNEGFEDANNQIIQIGNPAFFRLNLYACYRLQIKNSQLSFFVRVLNATNARYYHTAENLTGNFTASPQNPIAVLGGIQANFRAKSKKN